jgi:hypothetical protein
MLLHHKTTLSFHLLLFDCHSVASIEAFASPGLFRYVSVFVHIVSPEKGEAVPVGSSLTVSGNSDDNPQFNCKVLIIVNDKRPYQETIPVRPGDYSKWTFVVTP